MLKDTNYTAELDALRRSTHDAAPTDTAGSAGTGAEQGEEDGQVSTSEALDMLRQVRIYLLTYIKAASLPHVLRQGATGEQPVRGSSHSCELYTQQGSDVISIMASVRGPLLHQGI